ncbi:MAG: hypothetical protein U0T73_10365 [Chitinophagales bacterium]
MKKVFSFLTAGLLTAALVTTSSCTKTCDPGYEGSDCKTAMNAKFAGTYSVKDTATTGGTSTVYNYSMTITAPSSTPSSVSISNFGGFGTGTTISGTVDGTSLTVADGTLAGVHISAASGSINGSALHFVYTSTDSTSVSTSHAMGLK